MTLEQFFEEMHRVPRTSYTPTYGRKALKGFVVAVPTGICADCRKPLDDHKAGGVCRL